MRKTILSLLTLLLTAVLTANAQDLTVKSFGVAQGDISASVYPRNDRNGEPCGLIKVQLPLSDVNFEGNVMGNTRFVNGEYWVYMSRGAYRLSILHPQFHKLDLNLRELMPAAEDGFRGVEPKVTYNLVVNVPQTTPVETDDGMRYLVLKVFPANSRVLIDGDEKTLDSEGKVSVYINYGSHKFLVSAAGYADEQGEVVVEKNSTRTNKSITLQSVMANVTVSCPTPGAQIYVNDQLQGTSPWSGQLTKGNYRFEARLEGYRTAHVNAVLAAKEPRRITIPAITAITGILNVNYSPTDAEIWIDGTKAGTSPDIFRKLIIGEHQVELRAEGYQTKRETVTIREGQTTLLNGHLEKGTTKNSAPSNFLTKAIETFTIKGVSFSMVRVEGKGKPFYIGETEVTQALWKAVMSDNPSHFKGNQLPVENVSWEDCKKFLEQLNSITKQKFRLPQEAEWEYAAKGGNQTRQYKYSGSNTLDEVAWYADNSDNRTHQVKSKKANELGIFDMSGNVWEWCEDAYETSGNTRVNRGGSWIDRSWICESSYRFNRIPTNTSDNLGLRLAL